MQPKMSLLKKFQKLLLLYQLSLAMHPKLMKLFLLYKNLKLMKLLLKYRNLQLLLLKLLQLQFILLRLILIRKTKNQRNQQSSSKSSLNMSKNLQKSLLSPLHLLLKKRKLIFQKIKQTKPQIKQLQQHRVILKLFTVRTY